VSTVFEWRPSVDNHTDFDFSLTAHVRDPRGVITEYHTVCDDLIRNTGVEHIIGCYASASRKQVLHVFCATASELLCRSIAVRSR